MPFEMSMQAVVEEELMETMSFYKLFGEDMEEVMAGFGKNQEMDHQNDPIRTQVRNHLQDALDAIRRGDHADADRNIGAALQRLTAQEVLDLKDDKPRTDALIKIALYMEKAQKRIKRIKDLISENKARFSALSAH